MQVISGNTVVGYHGTGRAAAARILSTGFESSDTAYEWLGTGVYFFVDAPLTAAEWARARHDDPVTLKVDIDLGYCVDLLDTRWNEFLKDMHDSVLEHHRRSGMRLPMQNLARKIHSLDCGVINFACKMLLDVGRPVDTVRSQFSEGQPLYPDSAFGTHDHVQVAVRSAANITNVTVQEIA